MENGTDQNEIEKDDHINEQSKEKLNTENGELEYTEDEIPFADGDGTLLDDEIAEEEEENPEG